MAYKKKKMIEAIKYISKTEFRRETVSDVLSYPILANPERGMTKEDAEYYQIRSSLSEKDGKTITATYYPFFNKTGELTGFKKRDWTKEKDDDFHFTVVGSVKIGNQMFGQQTVKKSGKTLYIVEGEDEVWAARRCIKESLKGTSWEGKLEPNVIGLTLGCANAQEAVAHNEDSIRSFNEIVIVMNNDRATAKEAAKGIKKGKEATEEIAAFLMSDNISVVDIVDGHNDIRECLINGKASSMGKALAFERKKYSPEKIISSSDVSLEEIIAKREEGVYIDTFPKLMEKIHGFRTRELVVVTAPSNVGKSTIISHFGYKILEADQPLAMIMLEETKKETIQRLLAQKLGVNYNNFKDNPLEYCSKEQIEESYNWITKDCSLHLLDHFGSMQIDTFMNKIKSLVFINKAKFIIVDHLSMLISGSRVSDERKEVDIVMTELAAFCAANDVCIIAVSHLNRSIAQDFKPPKGKEDEPFWVPVTKEAMRSSAALEQLSWIVLGIEPQIMPDKSRGDVRITVLKNRPWAYLGIADQLYMDDKTGKLICREEQQMNF